MTTTPPAQDSNRPAYKPDEKGRMRLDDAIRAWQADRRLRSYRKVAIEVCSNYDTVQRQIKKVDAMLDRGELEIVGGQVRVRVNR